MKKVIMLVFVAAMLGFVSVNVSAAEEPKHPRFDPNAFMGKVIVTKDANGVVTAVQLESRRRGTYNIVLDAKGKELAEKMADKHVIITGTVATKDGVNWLTVEKYKEFERPRGPRGPGDPNRPRDPNGPHGGHHVPGGPPPGEGGGEGQ